MIDLIAATTMEQPDFRAMTAELLDWVERASDLHRYGTLDMMDRARAALSAAPVAPVAESVHYDFAVYDALTDEPQAGGEAPTLEEAQREGQHYFAMYSEDGPMRLELRRVEVLPLPEAKP